ncbi:MAG: ABC transporter permease, partial [Clostridia bacterium]|nr:ABC transporter permease [Clostridia bacterium]
MKTNNQKAGFLENAAVRSVLAALICILGGLVVGLIVLVLLTAFAEDISVAEAFSGIIIVLGGPFSGGSTQDILFQMGNMLFQSTPLILTGLSVALAFNTGLFNIGAPGQYL